MNKKFLVIDGIKIPKEIYEGLQNASYFENKLGVITNDRGKVVFKYKPKIKL